MGQCSKGNSDSQISPNSETKVDGSIDEMPIAPYKSIKHDDESSLLTLHRSVPRVIIQLHEGLEEGVEPLLVERPSEARCAAQLVVEQQQRAHHALVGLLKEEEKRKEGGRSIYKGDEGGRGSGLVSRGGAGTRGDVFKCIKRNHRQLEPASPTPFSVQRRIVYRRGELMIA